MVQHPIGTNVWLRLCVLAAVALTTERVIVDNGLFATSLPSRKFPTHTHVLVNQDHHSIN